MTRFDINTDTGWGLMRHKGVHEHPWPEAKKPDPLSKQVFRAEVLKNPQAGLFKMRVRKIFSSFWPLFMLFFQSLMIIADFVFAPRLIFRRETQYKSLWNL